MEIDKTNMILDINNLSFKYPSMQSNIIENLAVNLYEGESLAVLGKSGAGKSTLMHLIYGHINAYNGTIRVLNHNMKNKKNIHLIYRNIGIITQFDTLLYSLSIMENITMPLQIQGTHQKDIHHQAQQLINQVGLEPKIHHKINQLSGGEAKRVMIARALIHNPKLILCDEATADLDKENSNAVLDIILSMKSKNTSFVWITHDESRINDFDKCIRL